MFFKFISKNWYWLLDVKDDKVCVCQHKIMCKIWKSFVSRAWCKVSLCLRFYFPCIIGLKMNLQKYVLIYLIEMKDWMKIKILWRITVTDESSKIIFIINNSWLFKCIFHISSSTVFDTAGTELHLYVYDEGIKK